MFTCVFCAFIFFPGPMQLQSGFHISITILEQRHWGAGAGDHGFHELENGAGARWLAADPIIIGAGGDVVGSMLMVGWRRALCSLCSWIKAASRPTEFFCIYMIYVYLHGLFDQQQTVLESYVGSLIPSYWPPMINGANKHPWWNDFDLVKRLSHSQPLPIVVVTTHKEICGW